MTVVYLIARAYARARTRDQHHAAGVAAGLAEQTLERVGGDRSTDPVEAQRQLTPPVIDRDVLQLDVLARVLQRAAILVELAHRRAATGCDDYAHAPIIAQKSRSDLFRPIVAARAGDGPSVRSEDEALNRPRSQRHVASGDRCCSTS